MTDSWVGGDIGGLEAMGTAYVKAKKSLDDVVKPLGDQADKLVGDAGWEGEAASSFREAWTADSMAAGAFAELVSAVGHVLTKLSGRLRTAETGLQNAEDVAVRAGVPVGPKGVPGTLMTNNPPTPAESKSIKALHDYGAVRDRALHDAQRARLDAADDLRKLYADATGEGEGHKGTKGEDLTIADYLRALYSYDSERTRAKGHDAATKLDDAKHEADQAKKEMRAERKAYQKAGKALPKDLPGKGAYRDAMAKLDGLETDIARGERGSSALPYDHALNTKVVDAAKALRLGESAERLPEFLKEVPVVDIAAAGAVGLLEAKDDHDKGWSWTHSVIVDEGAALGGLAAGTAAVAGGVALAASAEITVPVAVVAGVGGAVVIGATNYIDSALHEHWSEDIHDHGVVGGILHGLGDAGSKSWQSDVNLAKDVGNAAKKAWNGFTGLF
ncbi:WXG100 family type VII secretion target [Streptomyces montanisoli]|uniref:WXG100 family type VII secretion target n=1 Tax=Streptomyces montanisoli TaxID=2798581 RepID=A0A940ME97_9ACTN|nr:hypothetical protein [Streptomyces montanisoli]MBP0461370.1 hypothetical protein [Streptomyces montanisoli]